MKEKLKKPTLIKDTDSMHYMFPYLLKNRTDCEAYISETVDITKLNEYLEKKNYDGISFKYTFFHVIAFAMAKVICLRPRMNRYYCNNKYYQRNFIRLAFVAKKIFSDEGGESLIIYDVPEKATIDTFHSQLEKRLVPIKSGGESSTGDIMDLLAKLPRPIFSLVMNTIYWLDKHAKLPQSLCNDDPYHASVFISNLGSIKLNSGYHHLTNFGTNSFFAIIGEKRSVSVKEANGEEKEHIFLDLGITLDERIADGYYFAKTLRLMRHLLQNPELLELPIEQEVAFE
ncbi:MAG: hypothetical protein J5922_00630 [Clostridia bacterium]|nr:hypothetical protein [Clostridia bacterium]